MSVTFPRDLVLEFYMGRWVNVTALAESRALRQVEPVTYVWGLPNEQSKSLAPPSTVEGALNNQGGHWTPGNAMSDYYDYLQGRNVPSRLGLRFQRDTFTRTVGVGWFAMDTGEFWQVGSPTGSDGYSVAAGVGNMTVGAANTYALAITGDSYGDCQVAGSCTVAINDVLGGAIEPVNLVLRYQGVGAFTGEHYLLRVSVSAAEVLTVAIFHSTLGAISSVVTVPGLVDAVSAKDLRGKFQVEGQTLRGKVYKRGPANDPDQFEPLGWQVSCHHERLTGGFPGWRSGVAAGNTNGKPITFACDDWDLRVMRHCGELSRLQPSIPLRAGGVKKADLKLAGITQRLGRKERPALSSAPRRYAAANSEFTTTEFWPLDEAAVAPAQGLNTVAGGSSATFQREFNGVQDQGAVRWGETDQVHTSVPGFVVLNNGGQLTFATRTTALGSLFSVAWAMRLSSDAGAKVFFHTATTSHFVFFFYTDGTWELFRNPGSVSVMTGQFALPAGLDGQWVTMALSVFNNGGGTNVGVRLTANGEDVGGTSWSGAAAYSPLQSVVLYVPGPTAGGQGDGAFSSLLVTNRRVDDILVFTATEFITVGIKIATATRGWIGERSGLRAFRLTAEESVPFDYFGDLGLTRPMGPQRPIPLIDHLEECADVNGDFLYEPRFTAGVALRPRRTMVGVTPTATLSYSSGHVAPPLALDAGDRPTANLVRAEKVDGGFVIIEQTAPGVMNTGDPQVDRNAVGRVPATATVNVESEASLPDVGGWVRALGTVEEMRCTAVRVDLAARELTLGADPTLPARQVIALSVGDRLLVQGLTDADVHRDLDQQVRGGREVFKNVRCHEVVLNTAPWEKFRGGSWGGAASRYDTSNRGETTLDAQLTSGTTGARNVTTALGPVWTNAVTAFPMDVWIGGERVTLSGITGTGAAQVITIFARNLNNLPVAGGKTHPAGTRVSLYQPVYHQ